MANKQRKKSAPIAADSIRQYLFDVEPELQTLEGVVALLRALCTTADQIEPSALAPLAHLSTEALGKIVAAWRETMAASATAAP
jgi:hypothetical protein